MVRRVRGRLVVCVALAVRGGRAAGAGGGHALHGRGPGPARGAGGWRRGGTRVPRAGAAALEGRQNGSSSTRASGCRLGIVLCALGCSSG